VADRLSVVVHASRFASAVFCLGLLLTLVSIMVNGLVQAALQYLATLGFVLAWAATSAGIYQRRGEWLQGTCIKALKWWGYIFVPVGAANLFFTVVNK
jgi:hypothetical protein